MATLMPGRAVVMLVENVQNSASWTVAVGVARRRHVEMTFKLEPRRWP